MLLYQITHGEHEQKIIQQCIRERSRFPDFIQNAPILGTGLELFYNGFSDLNSTRAIGMGLGSINWLTMNTYCVHYGIEGEQREDFFYHISAMDGAYLTYKAKEKPK